MTFHRANDVEVDLFNIRTGQLGIRRDVIDVALNGIGASAFDVSGEFRPTAKRRTVQAGNDWHSHSLFGFADVIEVTVGAGVKFCGLGKIGDRLREAFGACGEMVLEVHLFLVKLLFEERVEYDRGGARVFEATNAVDVA